MNPEALADLGASIIPLESSQAQRVLEQLDPLKRLELVDELLSSRIDSVTIKERVFSVLKKSSARPITRSCSVNRSGSSELSSVKATILKMNFRI